MTIISLHLHEHFWTIRAFIFVSDKINSCAIVEAVWMKFYQMKFQLGFIAASLEADMTSINVVTEVLDKKLEKKLEKVSI